MNGSLAYRFVGIAVFATFSGLSVLACEGNTTTTSTSSSGGGGDAGNGSGGSGGSGGGSNVGSNGELYATAFCDRIFDCCKSTELAAQFDNSAILDYAGCRIAYRSIWGAAFEAVAADGEKAGRVTFNQANFDACLKTFDGLACADLKSIPLYCADIFTPKVALGQTCFSSIECIDGKCDLPSGASMGTCVAKPVLPGLGEACTSSDGCAAGFYCNQMTCAAVKADGETCTDDDECSSGECVGTATKTCQTICTGGGPGVGAIDKPLESAGAELAITECNKFFDCCTGDEFDTVLFPGMRTKAQCYSLYGVFLGLGLVEFHNSVVQGKIAIDDLAFQQCINDYATLTCSEFAKNVSVACANAIKGLVTDGGACTDDNQCVSKYCNEPMPDQGTCEPLPGAGATCTSDCVEGFYCAGGTCVAKKAIGGMCSSNRECAEGRCYGPSGMKTCALICDGI
ncbi:MAG TPA: hypothetical protein PK156_40090 [Polyangium sp.]|nr:hypothetical protein [Polyangium sp.]